VKYTVEFLPWPDQPGIAGHQLERVKGLEITLEASSLDEAEAAADDFIGDILPARWFYMNSAIEVG
jgi:hypothetical protein